MTLAIQRDGSLSHAINATELEGVALEALGTWLSVDCGGGRHPSIEVDSLGPVACDSVEYNASGNANIVMIRDDVWPHPRGPGTLGKTRLVFEGSSGAIFDADIELNGVDAELSVGDPVGEADLLSILTHELGHFLGLDHSSDPEATMRARYDPGDTELRTLAQDDIDGICAIYPPGRSSASTSCTPRHGFSAECGGNDAPAEALPEAPRGCQLVAAPASAAGMPISVLALAVLAARRRVTRGGVERRPYRRDRRR